MAGESIKQEEEEEVVVLPPGFCFCPTDEQLVLHFLYSKTTTNNTSLPNIIIPDLLHDLSLLHPSQLNGKALSSGNQYYFFTKLNNETNRSTENGYYWKEITEATNPIITASHNKIGIKKYLVFQSPQGTPTNWIMQQYHHISSSSSSSAWVLCRVYQKNSELQDYSYSDDDDDTGTELSWLDEVYMTLDDDDLQVITFPN